MICFDVETLGVESTSVILSAASIHWDPTENFTYQDLIDRALFVKFDAKEQIKMGRLVDKGTVEWWSKQHEYIRQFSLDRKDDDLSAVDGCKQLREYYKTKRGENPTVWVRGSLDQVVIDSLTRQLEIDDMAPYNVYRDVRTAIDILCKTGKNGYCDIDKEGFDRNVVIKHHPVHDCALDIMMMRYGT